jgi:GT2 family glycosyltransferase
MKNPLVVSVILNSNRRDDTLACLSSLEHNSYTNQRIIFLDNASSDGSVDAVRSFFPDVQIIELDQNLGYAGNNDVGITAALDQGADWVFVLNEDTILAPDCLEKLVAVGESARNIGIIGPMVYHYDEPGVIQSAGGKMNRFFQSWHRGQNEIDLGQFANRESVDWISGCGIMVRREVIEQVGAIDERFFYYVEEFEWCVRVTKSGWKIIHVPQAKLWHKGVQRNYQPKPSIMYYLTRNRLFLLYKHHASLIIWLVTGFELLRTLISWTIRPKWRSKAAYRNAMWRGMVDFINRRWGEMPQ